MLYSTGTGASEKTNFGTGISTVAHDHSHHTEPGPGRLNRAFALGVSLNVGFVVVEALYGFFASSLALLADAGHNLSDVMSLLIAWVAVLFAGRRPTARRTYGFRRGTILASLLSSILLLLAMGGIAWEALGRFRDPAEVDGQIIIAVAAAGVVINGMTAMLFVSGRRHDLNIKAAFLHMAADAAVSLGVVLGGLGVLILGWMWLDPVISLVIVAVILLSTWGVLRDSINLVFDAVPRSIDPIQVRDYLKGLPGVADIHDLHIWAMSTTETALTAHLVIPGRGGGDAFLRRLADELRDRYRIAHVTIQVEQEDIRHGCDQEH